MNAPAHMSYLTDDLLQWSDLLASLCILGHDVTIKTDRAELLRYQCNVLILCACIMAENMYHL